MIFIVIITFSTDFFLVINCLYVFYLIKIINFVACLFTVCQCIYVLPIIFWVAHVAEVIFSVTLIACLSKFRKIFKFVISSIFGTLSFNSSLHSQLEHIRLFIIIFSLFGVLNGCFKNFYNANRLCKHQSVGINLCLVKKLFSMTFITLL